MKKDLTTNLLLLFVFNTSTWGQTITRIPYLQMPTDNSIIVMWRTSVSTNSRVVYGTNPTNLNLTVNDAANVTDHKIKITGLQPFTTYYYAIGTSSTILGGGTNAHQFTTHPLPGTEMPIRIWSIGDFGKGNTGQLNTKNTYLNYVDSSKTNVWLWLGDNAYDDGLDAEYQSKVFGYAGFNDLFSWLPFYPTPGNHDYNEVWVQSTFLGIPYSNIALTNHQGPYFDIVEVPQQAEAGGYPSNLEVFYSFDYGNVHFLSLNSEVYDIAGTLNGVNTMKAWISQDLQQNTQPFVIAYFHQPPYSKGSHDSDSPIELVMKTMREEVVPLLESYDVDIVLCGHSHVYERSMLIKSHYGNSSTFNPGTMIVDGSNGNFSQGNAYVKDSTKNTHDGTVYVVCGNGGSSESGAPLNHPAFINSSGGSYGSFIMEVNKNRLDAKYLDNNGSISDEFTLFKKNLVVQAIATQNVCLGDTLIVQASWTGGSDSLLFSWTNSSSTTSNAEIIATSSGTYTCTITDLLTGQSLNTTFSVNVIAPTLPIVNLSNDTLFAQQGFIYQWYLNGTPISGASNYFFIPIVNGIYTVELFDGGCSSTSAPVNYNNTGINELSEKSLKVYPNPSHGFFYTELSEEKSWTRIALINANGKVISEKQSIQKKMKWDTANLSSGIYFLILSSDETTVYKKIVKD